MDIKSRKLILLTMKMNNANQSKIRFTNSKIVNLEMFTQVRLTNIRINLNLNWYIAVSIRQHMPTAYNKITFIKLSDIFFSTKKNIESYICFYCVVYRCY